MGVACPSACLKGFHECFGFVSFCAGAPTGVFFPRSALVVTCDLFSCRWFLEPNELCSHLHEVMKTLSFFFSPPHIICYHFVINIFIWAMTQKCVFLFRVLFIFLRAQEILIVFNVTASPCAFFQSKVVTKPKVINVFYYI